MAEIKNIELENQKILVHLLLTPEEFQALNFETNNLLLVPTSSESLSERLTTGKLGNQGNRIMLPNKILEKHGLRREKLPKKAPAQIFSLPEAKLLVVKLEEKRIGVPEFKNEEE